MDSAISDFPYLWRFLKKKKLESKYFDPQDGKYFFSLSENSRSVNPSEFISPDAFLELRVLKGGVLEDHVSMLWAGSYEMQSDTETELLAAITWIAKRFDPLPEHFSFARVAYLQVLSDIKNARHHLIKLCNTEPVTSPPTHCGLWVLKNEKKSDREIRDDRLKIYNALVANSKIFCFKLNPDDPKGDGFLMGTIEDNVFTLNSDRLHSPPKPSAPFIAAM